MRHTSFNTEMASNFLNALGHKDNLHTFQTFDDSEKKSRSLSRILHGTLDEHFKTLQNLNNQGAGIFVTANQTDLQGRAKRNITGISAIWQDDDDGFTGSYPIPPNITVQSSPGKYQRYWLVEPGMTFDQHRQVMEQMVSDFGADNGAKDRARVLRVPEFYHRKNSPKKVKLISEINSKPYTVEEILAAFPTLEEKANSQPDTSINKHESQSHLENDFDIPEGERNSRLTSYAGSIWNKGIDGEDLVAVVKIRNSKLSEPLSDEEIESICASAERNFDSVEIEADPLAVVEKMNSEFAVLSVGGKIRVMRETLDELVRNNQEFLIKSDFLLLCASQPKVKIGKRHLNAGAFWLEQPGRREYRGLTFNPAGASPEFYNIWTGFAVEPKEGDCSLFLDHCLNVICRGNEEHFQYLMCWLAQLVQHPEIKIGVAIILRGLKGTGKGIFMNILGKLLGRHHILISQQRHLTGNFNAHLGEALLVCGDEITWGGDVKGEGPLKSLITEDFVMLEKKGIDSIQIPSFHRFVISTNSDWSVPASGDERRYFVLDVSDKRKKDFKYFHSMMEQMEKGGYEALLHHLQAFDTPGHIELRDPPRTAGLNEQVELSLAPVVLWLFDALKDRCFRYPYKSEYSSYGTDLLEHPLDSQSRHDSLVMENGIITWDGRKRYTGMVEVEIERANMTKSYIYSQKQAGLNARSASTTIGILLKKVYPQMLRSGNTARSYQLPPLTVLRRSFENMFLGYQYDWGDWKMGDCSPFEPVCESNLNIGCYPRCDAITASRMRYPQP